MATHAAWMVATALLIGGSLAGLVAWSRRRSIAALRFELQFPGVPEPVLHAIRDAEARYYAGRGPLRRGVEAFQDAAASALPDLVARADWSVGRYRVRPSTLVRLLPWAQAQGYCALQDTPPPASMRAALAYFATVQGTDAWQAAVVLEHLRREHPHLRGIGWDDIARDPRRVALLYSGYLGAGGDWDAWRASDAPGAEALRRLRPEGDVAQ